MPDRGSRLDLIVVGAGPAGLAATVTAASAGLRVGLIDLAGQPGGQFWRHIDESVGNDDGTGHHDWDTYTQLRTGLRDHIDGGRVTYLPGHQVWMIERGDAGARFTLHLTPSHPQVSPVVRSLVADAVVLCAGGYDRQLPVPGWTTPGVISAGAAQALLKGSRTLAGRHAVVAGTGPFLLPVAAGLAAAGATVEVCEANNPTRWLRHAPAAIRLPGKAIEALGYAGTFARRRVRYHTRTVVTRIDGDDAVTGVRISRLRNGAPVAGRDRELPADLVALGWGFTPSLELGIALGIDTRRDTDGSLVALVDDSQRSTVRGAYVAGEATGIGGAAKAVCEGELAGLVAASDLGRSGSDRRVVRLRARIRKLRAFAEAMHLAHPLPSGWTHWLDGDTLVCRCEEVTAGAVCAAHTELGAGDPRSAKSMVRPGMGWCQGRICGFGTAELLAARQDRPTTAAELRPLATRPCAAPLTLGELALAGHDDGPADQPEDR